MEFNAVVLHGDGAGSAVTTRTLNVSQAMGGKSHRSLNCNEGLLDGVAIDTLGRTLSYETLYMVVEWAKAELERLIVWNSI